jgi:hypothetical protein
VVAAQHQRHGAGLERRRAARIQRAADLGDRLDVFLPAVERVLRLGNRSGEIAFVDHLAAEPCNGFAEAGDTQRRRTHVHPAARAAEIEGDADDVNGLQSAP